MSWDEPLNRVVYMYNTCLQETMGETPFFIMHGFQPTTMGLKRTDMSVSLPETRNVQAEYKEFEKRMTAAKEQTPKAQERQT